MSLKLEGFSEAKRRIVSAIDYRIEKLSKDGGIFDTENNRAIVERADELKKLRQFVKGMCIKVEKSQDKTDLKIV